MTKLRSTKFTKGEYANQDIELPGVGVVTFDEDGNVEVPQNKVAQLLVDTKDSFAFEAVKTKEVPTAPATSQQKEKVSDKAKKEPADIDQSKKQPVNETTAPAVDAKTAALDALRAELEQVDLATLIDLAGSIPALAELDLAGKTDGELRELILTNLLEVDLHGNTH